MRDFVAQYLSKRISRRKFLDSLMAAGLTVTAAEAVLRSIAPAHAQPEAAIAATRFEAPKNAGPAVTTPLIKPFRGPGGASFVEQLIASDVKYVFGNSASEDAQFYEALVDRPELQYVLTPHEGPGAAMAAGYVKASGKPALVMQAGVVGMSNAVGQMFNAFKEQTPLVFYSYHSEGSSAAGRDSFEEVPNQEQMVQPVNKYTWLARRPDKIPEAVRHAFKASWTPPYGPSYISWHSDYNDEQVRTDIIPQALFDTNMRVRPDPRSIERAARLLVEAKHPVMIVGDEVYRAKAVGSAVKLAELLGLGVAQMRQVHASFPESHPLWVGFAPTATLNSVIYAKDADLVINVGNKLQPMGPSLVVPRGPKFVDMRIDANTMANARATDVAIVADVGYGLEDLIAAVTDLMTPALRQLASQRANKIRTFTERARLLLSQVVNNPEWNSSPLIADRVNYELSKFADSDAIIVHEAGSNAMLGFDFNPLGGRELFWYYGAHLGSGVGTAAGVKLARPNQQVICCVGDGSFIFGPTALWNMARLSLPVIVVVYNNHAYNGPHGRVISMIPEGRMVESGQFYHDYLGKPEMNMAQIAEGFGVDAEVARTPAELRTALKRARAATVDGRPYLVDVQVARHGVAWANNPWVPPINVAASRIRKV